MTKDCYNCANHTPVMNSVCGNCVCAAENGIRTSDPSNWKRIDSTEAGFKAEKIKTHFARIVVGGTAEKPYYGILYYDPADKLYHEGFRSYRLDYVRIWLEEEFENSDAPLTCRNCQSHEPCEVRNRVWCRTMGRYMKEDGFCSEGVKNDA